MLCGTAVSAGKAPTAGQYRPERAPLLADDRARHRHGDRPELLTEDQIRAAAGGGWPQALTLAGLGPAGEASASGRRGTRRAVPLDEALERCLDYHGALPSTTALEAFAAAHGFALKRRDAPWAAQIIARYAPAAAPSGGGLRRHPALSPSSSST